MVLVWSRQRLGRCVGALIMALVTNWTIVLTLGWKLQRLILSSGHEMVTRTPSTGLQWGTLKAGVWLVFRWGEAGKTDTYLLRAYLMSLTASTVQLRQSDPQGANRRERLYVVADISSDTQSLVDGNRRLSGAGSASTGTDSGYLDCPPACVSWLCPLCSPSPWHPPLLSRLLQCGQSLPALQLFMALLSILLLRPIICQFCSLTFREEYCFWILEAYFRVVSR